MKQEDLEALLEELQYEQLPPAPDLRSAVRAEIRRAHDRPATWRKFLPDFGFERLLLEPKLVLAAAVIALGIGTIPGRWTATAFDTDSEIQISRESLHLDVFQALPLVPAIPANHHAEG